MTDEQLDARPIPDQWSTREVVLHLADFDMMYANHMKRVVAEDRPAISDGDAGLFTPRLACNNRDVDQEVWLIKAIRRHMAAILRSIDANDFERIGLHAADGPLTLTDLLKRITDHIPHHVRSVEEKRLALNAGKIEMPLHMAGVGIG
jgi:hypothetical protein